MGGNPFIGMLLAAGFNFAPQNSGLWALCAGQLISIAQNEALYTLLGTTFGGDGVNTFGLPDLRGRTPIHFGTSPAGTYVMGEMGGAENVMVTTNTMAQHGHSVYANGNTQNSASPNNNFPAQGPQAYTNSFPPNANLASSSITFDGGSLPHPNLQPFQTLNWIIALTGIYPTPN
jgi:microcystin-dependent protein